MIQLTISGSVPSKKNSRQNFVRGNRVMSVPNQAYMKWEREALRELGVQAKSLKLAPITEYPIAMRCEFQVKDLVHRDLDNMLASVLDVLKTEKKKGEVVRQGIIEDDSWRFINPIHVQVSGVDKENPRVTIFLGVDIEPIV